MAFEQGGVHERATTGVTQDLSFSGLVKMTATWDLDPHGILNYVYLEMNINLIFKPFTGNVYVSI
jgi:hypothetical protein